MTTAQIDALNDLRHGDGIVAPHEIDGFCSGCEQEWAFCGCEDSTQLPDGRIEVSTETGTVTIDKDGKFS